VAALLLVASPALAAPAWLSPIDLSAVGSDEPQIAVDPAGNATAIWNGDPGGLHTGFIESASHPAGGSWSQPTKLSTAGAEPFGPQIAVDPAGNAVAIWFNFNGNIVESASRPVGGSWSLPTKLGETGGGIDARVAVDPAGNAVAIWARLSATESIIESASHPAGGDWSGPVKVAVVPRFVERPRIALDPSGNAVAIWDRLDPAGRVIESASRPAAGSWSDPTRLSAVGAEAIATQVAVDSAGNAVAIWRRVNATESNIESASRPIGGDWSGPTPVSPTGIDAERPQLAVDPAGNAVAIWARLSATESIIESASHPAAGSWSEPTQLSAAARSATGNDASQPQIAVDPAGNAVAIWRSVNGPNTTIIESASHPVGGSWSAPIGLSSASGSAFEPQIALDPSGNEVAIWSRFTGTDDIIQAAAFDGAGPKFQSVGIPSSGRAGSKLRFAVSALDSWSALGQSTWSFGDRKSASGLSTTHAYAKPGLYQLTLRVSDALDNATTTTARIKIASKAKAARLARVRKGKALLSLRCPKPAKLPCEGLAKLRSRHGKKKKLVLGQRSFKIAGAKHRTVAIKLSAKAKHLLAAAGPKGLTVKLSGSGVSTQTLRLR
jgi:PKD domain